MLTYASAEEVAIIMSDEKESYLRRDGAMRAEDVIEAIRGRHVSFLL